STLSRIPRGHSGPPRDVGFTLRRIPPEDTAPGSAPPHLPAPVCLPLPRLLSLRRGGFARIAGVFEGGRDFVEDGGIVDGGGQRVLGAVGDLLHGAAEDLARARLGQALNHDGELEGGHGADVLAHPRHELARAPRLGSVPARLWA